MLVSKVLRNSEEGKTLDWAVRLKAKQDEEEEQEEEGEKKEEEEEEVALFGTIRQGTS